MKASKILIKAFLYLLALPLAYVLLAMILSEITVNRDSIPENPYRSIYLNTNGVHLDIVLEKAYVSDSLLQDLYVRPEERYLSFGWGDSNFYLNTPIWDDLTASTAVNALFLESASLMHITRYRGKSTRWVEVPVSKPQWDMLNRLLLSSFRLGEQGGKIRLRGKGYSRYDDFYWANGSYSFTFTCNSWANSLLKQSGLKAAVWTPFDFPVLNKYR